MDREARWRRYRPGETEIAVLVAGITSMGLEILAGRMIAPQFGSSIYTWGSIIGVFLAALSLGYHLGGRRAKHRATTGELATLLLWAAAYVAFVLFAGNVLLRVSSALPVPARFAPLVPVALLFGPPVYLLGFISPYAAELSSTESTGEASGRVYALGTTGSIAGAFGTTFLLIPSLSIDLIGLVFGVLLVGTAALLALPPLSGKRIGQLLVVAVLLLAAVAGGSLGVTVPGEVVYETQTPYQHLQVVDRGDVRTLYLDGQPHSAMDLDDPNRHVFTYTRYFHLAFLFTEDVDRVLFIGGGGFTGPKIFARTYNVTVEVAEIDPTVVRVAKEYFGVKEDGDLRIHVVGGRQFLQETDRTYDVIVLDAYKKDKVPFQLTTVEFMRLASAHLDEDGVLLANVISAPSGPGSAFFRAEYKTISQVFPQVHAYRTTGGGGVQNIEIVATKRADRLSPGELRSRLRRRHIGYDLEEAIDRRVGDVRTADVPVLRDGKAPVEALLDPMLGRKYVIEGPGGENWTERPVGSYRTEGPVGSYQTPVVGS
ncbi:MAG: spermidine synthase [Halodesulfurarchaeum sp.]